MYDEEIEKAILFGIIFDEADYQIEIDDFMNSRNKKIANAIIELRKNKEDISMLSIQSKIKANQTQVLEYLAHIGNYYTKGTNLDELYNELKKMTKKRKIFELANKIMQEIEKEDVDVYSEKIIKKIQDINKEEEKEKDFISKLSDATIDLENKWKNQDDYSLYTGISDLDKILCGLHNQELTIIGARPRSRKNYIIFANTKNDCKRWKYTII
jgi:replicative DNA helicase